VRRNQSLILKLLLVSLYLPLQNVAQEVFSQPPSKKITSIPFKIYSGGVVVIKAKLDNYPDSLNFILDTGSGGISLDSTTVKDLKICFEASDKTIRGIAGMRKVNFAYNHTLYFKDLKVDSLNFHINDYNILTSVYGEKVDGIMGYSFLNRYILKINYDSSIIHVYTKGNMKYPRGGYLIKPLLVNIPVNAGIIKDDVDITTRFYFDTGAGLCLLLSSDFVADSTVFNKKRKMYNTQAEGLGGKAQMKITYVKEFKLGPYKFKKVPAYIFDDEFNVTSYPYLGGLIGNDLLRRFNIIINYEKKDIHLTPNTHFREPFDYAYTGLGIYYINHAITVTDIMPNSPAEKAGFKEGDIIISINNNINANIQVYKNMLQTAGAKLSVVVIRNEGPVQLYLKVKNILH
jgi:PDZ domain/Aspartyl protease